MSAASMNAAGSSSVGFDQSARETVESIVVAVILAFLFRGFVAEAFVIPTGSMAPTLQGRHMDVVCSECGYQYRTGASVENDDFGPPRGEVTTTRCPLCRYSMKLDKEQDVNQRSFNGDRILVSKFAYQFQEPERWDVIVFKYPGNAKINYIKRLIGLPGETIRIQHGDVHILDPATADQPEHRQKFNIERKPPDKVLAMLQLVDDSRYTSQRMKEAGWPSRWIATTGNGWEESTDGAFSLTRTSSPAWLRYRHLIPRTNHWRSVGHQEPLRLDSNYMGHLITDYYTYNDFMPQFDADGECWVGDLAFECQLDVRSGEGDLLLDLVEGGSHFLCTINVATGSAQMMIDGGKRQFSDLDGRPVANPTAPTAVRAGGRYTVRFANIDDQLLLWVNDALVTFDGPTTFVSPDDVVPRWTESDPGDVLPVGIASKDCDLQVNHLRVLRDVYYRAVGGESNREEYETSSIRSGDNIDTVMSQPQSWSQTNLFASRQSLTFELGPDQFFPLGDNSPESRDARLWSSGPVGPPPYVSRELLIGKALAIYWPHGWRLGTAKIGFIPNYQRISLIR